MTLQSISISYLAIISLLISFSKIEASNPLGFTIDLIHRDSPQSPFYDSSLSPSQRFANALQRSFHRIHRLNTNFSTQSPVSKVIDAKGEFLMEYSIGTPPVPSLGIIDTGSGITWTQCLPCDKCFKQKPPLFQPKKSSTYQKTPCNSTICKSLIQTDCNKTEKVCQYTEEYGDGSFSYGELASDTISLGSTTGTNVSFPNVTIGCGFSNGGIFSGAESGIVGLGTGKGSLIRQIESSIQGKFSYCFVSFLTKPLGTSKLNFGNNAVVEGKAVVSTPLVLQAEDNSYYLILEGISVGNQRMEFLESKVGNNNKKGNIIIDSGSIFTSLPQSFYDKIKNALESSIKLRRIPDPQKILDLCYFTRENSIPNIPEITIHFRGADLKLNAENIFIRTTNTSLCFAVVPQPGLAIYGNLAQSNFLVGYDLQKKTVSFKPMDCTQS